MRTILKHDFLYGNKIAIVFFSLIKACLNLNIISVYFGYTPTNRK